MEFNPNNNIIKLCMQGMAMEEQGKTEEACNFFMQAWNNATNDFEKFIAAYFVARNKSEVADKLKWNETSLEYALKINDDSVKGAFASLYTNIAWCYEALGDNDKAKKYQALAEPFITAQPSDKGPFYHGTRADMQIGDLLTPGRTSNYKDELVMNHIYFTAVSNGAGLAAALAKGDGRERVYIVEPTGSFENDPNVTDKKFPGNPTRSYRTTEPLKITGELDDWQKLTPEQIQAWKEKLAKSNGEIIN